MQFVMVLICLYSVIFHTPTQSLLLTVLQSPFFGAKPHCSCKKGLRNTALALDNFLFAARNKPIVLIWPSILKCYIHYLDPVFQMCGS